MTKEWQTHWSLHSSHREVSTWWLTTFLCGGWSSVEQHLMLTNTHSNNISHITASICANFDYPLRLQCANLQLKLQGRETLQCSRCSGFDWIGLDWAVFYVPTKYRLYGRRFLQVKRPNQQYQSTEGRNSTQTNQTYNKQTWTQNTASPLVYTNMGWLGDSSHRGQQPMLWYGLVVNPQFWGGHRGLPSGDFL